MNHAVNGVIALIVVLHGLNELLHGKVFLVIDIVFYSCDTVGDCADSHALDVVCVVSGAACIVVLRVGDAVVCHNRQTGGRHLLGVQLLNHIVASYLYVHDILQLLLEGIPELVVGLEIPGIAQFQTDLLSAVLVKAIEQRELEHLGNIQVSRQDVGFASPGTCLHAPRGAAPSGVLQLLAGIDKLHNLGLRVVEGGLSPALP